MTGASPMDRVCRSCGALGLELMVDLGRIPLGSEFPATAALASAAPTWPLRAWICSRCLLLQLDDTGPDEAEPEHIGPGYRSPSLMRHVDSLVAAVLDRIGDRQAATIPGGPRILEVASHGGYVQEAFESRGLRTLIAEASAARVAAARLEGRTVARAGVDVEGSGTLAHAAGGSFDVIVDEFLLAHLREPVPFLAAVRGLLAPDGFAVLELAHVGPTIEEAQFDSIRHGHFSYFSLYALEDALRRAGLEVFDVEQLPLYGGSLRVWVQVATSSVRPVMPAVAGWRETEEQAGLHRRDVFTACAGSVERARQGLRGYLERARTDGLAVVGYGAPSRATTLLAACGVTPDLLPFTVDRSPAKQGCFVPGSAIPIRRPEELVRARPDIVLVLTWDIAAEVVAQLPEVRGWGGRFVVPIPDLLEIT